jgi:hypothetical protein
MWVGGGSWWIPVDSAAKCTDVQCNYHLIDLLVHVIDATTTTDQLHSSW